MKRTKQEKAITLVALIITIIVLLILAVVTIAAITGEGDLISHANNAKEKYTDESEIENTTVQEYLEKIPGENSNLKNLQGTYTLYGTDIGETRYTAYIRIDGEKIFIFSDDFGKESECNILSNDNGIFNIEYEYEYESSDSGGGLRTGTDSFLIKRQEKGILVTGYYSSDSQSNDIHWSNYAFLIDKNQCGNNVKFTLLDGMKFNVPTGLYGRRISRI